MAITSSICLLVFLGVLVELVKILRTQIRFLLQALDICGTSPSEHRKKNYDQLNFWNLQKLDELSYRSTGILQHFLYIFAPKTTQTTPILCYGYFGNCDKRHTRKIQNTEIGWRFLYILSFNDIVQYRDQYYSFFMAHFLVNLSTTINGNKAGFKYSIVNIVQL